MASPFRRNKRLCLIYQVDNTIAFCIFLRHSTEDAAMALGTHLDRLFTILVEDFFTFFGDNYT